MLRRGTAWARSVGRTATVTPFLPPPLRGRRGTEVQHAPGLDDLGRQDAGLERHDANPQAQALAQARLDRARVGGTRQLHLDLHLVHRAGVVVEGDPELADAAELAQDLLDR